jgi:hypothetical protein
MGLNVKMLKEVKQYSNSFTLTKNYKSNIISIVKLKKGGENK